MMMKSCFQFLNQKKSAIRSFLICILFLSAFSCQKNERNEIKQFLKDFPNKEGYSYYLIVPFLGCQGCYSNAEMFIITNISKLKKFQFYITGAGSEKMMQIRYGPEVMKLNNIIFIPQSIFNSMPIKSLEYPTLIEFREDQLQITLPDLDSLKAKLGI